VEELGPGYKKAPVRGGGGARARRRGGSSGRKDEKRYPTQLSGSLSLAGAGHFLSAGGSLNFFESFVMNKPYGILRITKLDPGGAPVRFRCGPGCIGLGIVGNFVMADSFKRLESNR
jgi:hypothetical protein